MLDRGWNVQFRWRREERPVESRRPSRNGRRPQFDCLEERVVLNAALAAIPDVSVPSSLGYQVSLDGSASGATKQTFTVTSSNPDIKAAVATGPFATVTVSHTSSGAGDPTITNQSYTYQMFQDLTPNTTSRISNLITNGFYTNKTIHRIVSGFGGVTGPAGFVIQGGSVNGDGTGSVGTGAPLELNQQLAFVQPYTVAIANAGPNTDDSQFFITTGPQPELNFGYTIYGQVVSGFNTITQLTQVATKNNTASPPEKSVPINPVIINSSTLSNDNPNGVIHIDATGAIPGETATINVTATDPATNTTATQSFKVTIITDTTTHPSSFTFKPLTYPLTQDVSTGLPTTLTLANANTNQNPQNPAVKTSYAIVTQPQHGTLSNFNATAGTVDYTPNPNYTGPDTFSYQATNTGGTPSPLAGNIATATLNITTKAAVNTGFVRQIGGVLIVSPSVRANNQANTVVVSQANDATDATKDKLVVNINGETDTLQPLVSSVTRIIVYGSKRGDTITIDPSVSPSIHVLLDGGHGIDRNVLTAGAGPTREHGWFGRTILTGGTGQNQLVGRAGHVKFVPTSTTTEMFAGGHTSTPRNVTHLYGRINRQLTPPTGQFYRYVKGRIVPVSTPAATRHSQ